MKNINIFLLILLCFIVQSTHAETLIDNKTSFEIILGSSRPLVSEERSHFYVKNESKIEVYSSEDEKFERFIARNNPEEVVLQSSVDGLEWYYIDQVDIKVRIKKHRKKVEIIIPKRTYKVSDALGQGKKILLGFRDDDKEIIRIFDLEGQDRYFKQEIWGY